MGVFFYVITLTTCYINKNRMNMYLHIPVCRNWTCILFQVLLKAQQEFLNFSTSGISVLGELQEPNRLQYKIPPWCSMKHIETNFFCFTHSRDEPPSIRFHPNYQQNRECPARAAVSSYSRLWDTALIKWRTLVRLRVTVVIVTWEIVGTRNTGQTGCIKWYSVSPLQ